VVSLSSIGVISPSNGTGIGLGDSFFVFLLKRNLKEIIFFKLTKSVGKRFLKIMANVDTSPSLASSKKRQNLT
jgi:hypothetical protein